MKERGREVGRGTDSGLSLIWSLSGLWVFVKFVLKLTFFNWKKLWLGHTLEVTSRLRAPYEYLGTQRITVNRGWQKGIWSLCWACYVPVTPQEDLEWGVEERHIWVLFLLLWQTGTQNNLGRKGVFFWLTNYSSLHREGRAGTWRYKLNLRPRRTPINRLVLHG